LNYIKRKRAWLSALPAFEVTSYGPSGPNDSSIGIKHGLMTGKKLVKVSTNPYQGEYLTKLTIHTARKINDHIKILELGTAAGISGMYLLAGMALVSGGHLITFEGSQALAELSEHNLHEFVVSNGLLNVDFEIIVGNFDDTLESYIHSDNAAIHMAFIDRNHQKEPTLRYHKVIRNVVHECGLIVHDDISWSQDMPEA